ncbi:nucleotidyltransferase family protein [Massilia sp. PWRC2]|uniref:nucleotidyltransferase family protein n=1 Tax=Massilia sp. PWRC2 TaxID=2804626 RepID=UPI003CE82A84
MAARPQPVGILLAAGRGRRFDPSGQRNKLLQILPASGEPVLAASARHLTSVLQRVVAVVRPGDDDLAALLRAAACEVVVCSAADDGMAASLGAALQASIAGVLPAQSWIVALGDMPDVAPATVAALADVMAGGAALAAPVYQGRRGNPAAFAASLLPELLALRGDAGARSLFERHPWTAVVVMDAGVLRDIDVPGDL